MKVVLDTNIILSCVSRYSPYHFVLESLFSKIYEAYITTDILLEYEEKLTRNFSNLVAESFIGALLIASNIKKADVYFDLELIKTDADDNKFVNCAFAANVVF